MINDEPADHPPFHPPPNQEFETPPKSFLPVLFLILVVYCSFRYRPVTPFVTVTTVQISDYTLSTSSSTTASFTFSFEAAVANPTQGDFSYSSTSSHLFHNSKQVRSLLIPGRIVAPGTENVMNVSMFAKPIPVSIDGYLYMPSMLVIGKMKQTIDLEMQMKIVGRMNFLRLFSRPFEEVVECHATIAVSNGSLLVYHC